MNKLLKMILTLLMAIMLVSTQNISAKENSIPIEIQEKLNTYVTYPKNLNTWELMDSEEVVVYIDGYKITRGDYIKLNDYAYKVDASKITADDYVESNSRAITSSYINLGSNSVGAAYKTAIMYYTTSYGSTYSQTIYREYATRNQISTWLNTNPSSTDIAKLARDICEEILKGMAKSVLVGGVPIGSAAKAAFMAMMGYQSIAARNAFLTYTSTGKGGYIDKIENEDGDTIGYGVWNQTSIELRNGSSNGQTVTTKYEKSTRG